MCAYVSVKKMCVCVCQNFFGRVCTARGNLKNEDNFQNEDDLKNVDELKNKNEFIFFTSSFLLALCSQSPSTELWANSWGQKVKFSLKIA